MKLGEGRCGPHFSGFSSAEKVENRKHTCGFYPEFSLESESEPQVNLRFLEFGHFGGDGLLARQVLQIPAISE